MATTLTGQWWILAVERVTSKGMKTQMSSLVVRREKRLSFTFTLLALHQDGADRFHGNILLGQSLEARDQRQPAGTPLVAVTISKSLPVRTAIVAPPPVAAILAAPPAPDGLPAGSILFIAIASRASLAGGVSLVALVVVYLSLGPARAAMSASAPWQGPLAPLRATLLVRIIVSGCGRPQRWTGKGLALTLAGFADWKLDFPESFHCL